MRCLLFITLILLATEELHGRAFSRWTDGSEIKLEL